MYWMLGNSERGGGLEGELEGQKFWNRSRISVGEMLAGSMGKIQMRAGEQRLLREKTAVTGHSAGWAEE